MWWKFIGLVIGCVASFALLIVAAVWVVDPYAVSPIKVSIARFNAEKPARSNIERQLKPYEVWQRQPKTILVGTSRVSQALDPEVLDGSQFAPAYNAAVPASSMPENAAYLAEFLDLAPSIRHVVLELFFTKFVYPQPAPILPRAFLVDALSLHFGVAAIGDAARTVRYNWDGDQRPSRITADGQWVHADTFVPGSPFSAEDFAKAVLGAERGAKFSLQNEAMQALDQIVAICAARGVTLHLVIIPNYPWDDYRLTSLGYWPMLEDWLRRMAAYPNVVSFSQYNEMLQEAPRNGMKWWYDPIHPSAEYGRLVLNALAGRAAGEMPENLMRPLTPATAEAVIAERREGARAWAARNADFTAEFERAKVRYLQ